jgi:hypothetical protein
MTFRADSRLILGLPVILAIGALMGSATTATNPGSADAPKLHIVSPARAFMVGAAESRKLFVCLEITDAAGKGIAKTEFGVPRFVEPNRNVEAFVDGLVARSSYTNNLGQEIEQYAALIPVEKLRAADFKVAPPIDFQKVRPAEGERVVDVPVDAMIEAASFNFQVQGLDGEKSDADAGKLVVGLAPRLWVPADLPAPRPPTQ